MQQTRANAFLRQAIWPVIFALLIIAASHRPYIPAPQISHIDKIAHFVVYGLLATLVCRLGTGWRSAIWTVVAVSAFGALDEWHQSFVPGRFPEFADWIADTLGAITAVMLYNAWTSYRRWLEHPVRAPLLQRSTVPRAAADDPG